MFQENKQKRKITWKNTWQNTEKKSVQQWVVKIKENDEL